MEKILDAMLDERTGVPVKTVKSFLSKIPSVFAGMDLVQWLMRYFSLDEQEAIHLAHQFACYGYLFPIDDHVLTVKNDNTFYRFQTPYFWPSKCWEPENTDYAVYLCKRTMQNKAHLELEDFEAENLAKLQKQFARKWEFIFMQAEAQYKVDKKRDRLERQILDSQERSFWDVHRPVPGCVNTTEVDFRKLSKLSKQTYQNHSMSPKGSVSAHRWPLTNQVEAIRGEINLLTTRLSRNVLKTSKVAESLITFYDQRQEFDGFLIPTEPSNPWIHDSVELWLEDKSACIEPSCRRVRRWALSLEELLEDVAGREQFLKFLQKEYAVENIRFWQDVQKLKGAPNKDVGTVAKTIYEEYLGPNAASPVNVDSKVVDASTKNMESPSRYTFDEAVEHIHQLMKNDSYQRFLRSDFYKELGSRKKFQGSTKSSTFRIGIVPANVWSGIRQTQQQS